MDATDKQLLRLLMADGRATWSALAEATGLSAAALAQRVRRLERAGVIQGYAARLDPAALEADLLAFVAVRFADPARRDRFLKSARGYPWLQECHHITGEMDYLLKVRCRNTKALERILDDELREKCKVTESRTSIVLATAKETTDLAIPD